MLALTVWQPWASLISSGHKAFEFRGWPMPARARFQPVAIHAGARPVRLAELRKLRFDLATGHVTGIKPDALPLIEQWCRELEAKHQPLWLSSIVAVVKFGEPIRNAELEARMGAPVLADSDREEHTLCGWPVLEVQAVSPPIPARGRQGFWRWDPPMELG